MYYIVYIVERESKILKISRDVMNSSLLPRIVVMDWQISMCGLFKNNVSSERVGQILTKGREVA